jgi:hypothetical protein
MQTSDHLPHFSRAAWLLKHSNGCDSSGARLHAFRRVFFVDTSDRDHRNLHAAADLAEPRNSLRGPVRSLGRRIENRSEENVTSTRQLGFLRFFQGVARGSD